MELPIKKTLCLNMFVKDETAFNRVIKSESTIATTTTRMASYRETSSLKHKFLQELEGGLVQFERKFRDFYGNTNRS